MPDGHGCGLHNADVEIMQRSQDEIRPKFADAVRSWGSSLPIPSFRWKEENKMPERTRLAIPDFLLHTVLGHLSEGCDLSALGSRRVVALLW
jgi:hypothetical protein